MIMNAKLSGQYSCCFYIYVMFDIIINCVFATCAKCEVQKACLFSYLNYFELSNYKSVKYSLWEKQKYNKMMTMATGN